MTSYEFDEIISDLFRALEALEYFDTITNKETDEKDESIV